MAIGADFDNLAIDQEVDAAGTSDFSELWEHRAAIQRLCEAMVGHSNAEDVVQETYLRALKLRDRLERRDSTEPWLATVARRRSIDEIRAKRHLVFLPTPPEPSPHWSDDPAQRVVDQELLERLQVAMDRLTVRERRVLLRRVSDGLPLDEIALCEDASVASVRSVLSRARHKLRASLERGGMLASVWWRAADGVRQRAHRWLPHFDAALPMVVGVGWELRRMVGALVVAVMALFTSVAPAPSATLRATDGAAGAFVRPGPAPDRPGVDDRGLPPPTPGDTALGLPFGPGLLLDPALPAADVSDGGHQPEDARITSLAAGADGRTVVAGGVSSTTGTWVLYRSNDAGRSWSRLGTNSLASPERDRTVTNGTVLLAPGYPLDPRVFVVAGSLLRRSDDGGHTFRTVSPLRGSAVLSPRFSVGDARLFASGPPPLVFSDDDGRVEPMPTMPPWVEPGGIALGSRFAADGELLVGGTVPRPGDARQGAVFECRPSGCVQRAVLPGLSGPPQILVSQGARGVVFAWQSDAVFRSTDDGHTFSRYAVPAGVAVNRLVESRGRIYLLGTRIGADGAAFYVTADGGNSWAAIGTGSPLQQSVGTAVALGRGRLLAAPVGATGLLCSDDGGATWAPRCGRN